MPHVLANLRVLVVEDELLIACDLANALEEEGATVIGPAATLAQGEALCASGQRLDGAVLDINLQGQAVFPLADELRRTHVPFLFSTGYDGGAIPPRFADIPCCEKPVDTASLIRWLTPSEPVPLAVAEAV